MKSFLRILLLIAISAPLLCAQNTFESLRLDVSPRAAGMGGALVASDDDPDVMFYNPSGVAKLTGTPASFSFLKHLLDVNMASISVAKNYESIGYIGVGVKYINYGDFTGANEYGEKTSNFGAGDLSIQGTYANFLDENISYGVTLNFIYSKIENYSSTGLAADFGLNYGIPQERINIGVSVLHAGSQLSTYDGVKEDLPVDLRIGVSKKLLHLPLKFFVDFQRLNQKQDSFFDRFKNFTIGGELVLGKTVKARLGLDNLKRIESKIANYAGIAGFSLGLGINVSKYTVNYSFTSLGQIGGLHRFGVTSNIESLFN